MARSYGWLGCLVLSLSCSSGTPTEPRSRSDRVAQADDGARPGGAAGPGDVTMPGDGGEPRDAVAPGPRPTTPGLAAVDAPPAQPDAPAPPSPSDEPPPLPKPEPRSGDGIDAYERVPSSERRIAAGPGVAFDVEHVFWAEAEGATLVLDVIHFQPREFGPLARACEAALTKAAETDEEDDDERARFMPSHRALRSFRKGEPLTAVGPEGRAAVTATGFCGEYGASDGHLTVRLEPRPGAAEAAVVVRGAVDADARLRVPEAATEPSPAVVAELERIRSLARSKRRMKTSTMELRAAAAGSQLVSVSIPRRDEEDAYPGFSGLVVVEPSGKVHALVAPGRRAHQLDVHHLVDLDGDGVDEVVLTTDYFETSGYTYLAVWNGRRYALLRLAGDGG